MDRTSDALTLLERRENLAWGERVLGSDVPFAERWVAFWANHLTVSRRSAARNWTGHYEREAIRPLAFGRFDALLLGAYRHPAMLNYLDQARSVGPGSPAGRRRRNGLNENLARECLELHTITPGAGLARHFVADEPPPAAIARIEADWPGLARPQLFENRDLMPTMDLRRIAKGLLAGHLGLDAAALARAFPDSTDATPLPGLLRA